MTVKKIIGTLAICSGLALLVACGNEASPTSANEPTASVRASDTAPDPEAPEGDSIDYATFGIVSKEAPASATPTIPEAQVLKDLQTTDLFDRGLMPGEPDVSLAMWSTGNFEGEDNKRTKPVLAWVFVFEGSPADIKGPAMPDGEKREFDNPAACRFVAAYDATEGDALSYFQDCSAP